MKHVQDSTTLADLFAAERAAAPEPGAMERDWSRLSEALSSGAAPLAIGGVTLSAASPLLGKLGSGLAIGLLIGAGAAAGAHALTTHSAALESPAPVATAKAAAERGAPGELVALADPAAAARSAEPTTGYEPKQLAPAPSLVASSARRGPDFDAELRLIELAKQQIDAGRPHLARIWLAEHQQRFPAGVFTVERRALLTLAGCAEQSADAPRAAADFARAYPTSPFIDRIRSACEARRLQKDSGAEMNLPPRGDERSKETQ
jgi:hypothetical protein